MLKCVSVPPLNEGILVLCFTCFDILINNFYNTNCWFEEFSVILCLSDMLVEGVGKEEKYLGMFCASQTV